MTKGQTELVPARADQPASYVRTARSVSCCAVFAILFGWLWIRTRPHLFELCSGRLVQISEPANWRALPEASGPPDDSLRLGPFVVTGYVMMPKYGLGWADSGINDPGFCVSSGVSLAPWFERGPEPAYSRSPSELHLREDRRGEFVVSAAVWGSDARPENQTFVVAFRRRLGVYPSFVSPAELGLGVLLSVGLLSSLYGGVSGARALLQMRRADAEGSDAPTLRRPDADIARARLGLRVTLAALAVGAIWLVLAIVGGVFSALGSGP